MRRSVRVLGGMCVLALAASCTNGSLAVKPQPRSTSVAAATTTSPTPVTKLLVFVEENHSLAQMRAGMPYAYGLAKKYGYASNYKAITRPSLPNYLAIAGGSTFGVRDNYSPASHKVRGPSVFGTAINAGKTAASYVDAMNQPCQLTASGSYAVKHNPWAYFVDERKLCQKYDLPVASLDSAAATGTLPNVGMVIPDLNNDAHDRSLTVADQWFKSKMDKIFAGPDWKSGRLAVVLTADEDDRLSGNRVLTIVIHPSQRGKVVSTALTHYSLNRLYTKISGTPPMGSGATAPSIIKAFGLPIP